MIRALSAIALLVPAAALAQFPLTGPGGYYLEWQGRNDRSAEQPPPEFKLINYFFVRGTATNELANPSGLRGVSLGPIGSVAGSNTRTGKDTGAYYIEQRWIPVLAYSPHFVDRLATFRAQLEIDYTWGIAANAVQQNQGGGLNADQVNVQTKQVNVSLYPTRRPEQLSIVIGTQAAYDSIYDPAITSLFDVTRTGYKLAFLGTDATGLSVYGKIGGLWKASFIPIGGAQPNLATEGDARFSYAYLVTADYARQIQPDTVVGLSLWRLQDDTQGAAYAFEGLVKSGPSSGGLSSFTGTRPLPIEQPTGGVNYLGLNFHHNINFRTSDLGASGFVMVNQGRYESQAKNTQLQKAVDVLGVSANLELMWAYGKTTGDLITLEGMVVSGDDRPGDGKYTSAFTANYYGLPGAVWFNHKTLLMFPFTSVVNNYTGAVTDISNQGYGLETAILGAAHDFIPDKLNLKLGAAYGRAAVNPPAVTVRNVLTGRDARLDRGQEIGLELNAEVRWQIRYLMTVGLHGGVLLRGDFYHGDPLVTRDPLALFTTFTWYGF